MINFPDPNHYPDDTYTYFTVNQQSVQLVFVRLQINNVWYWVPTAETFLGMLHYHG